MSGIPYNKLQTIDCTAKKEDGESVTIAVLHYAFVIPCRDCKYGINDGELCAEGASDSWDWRNVEPDGFCAWAVRKVDA